MRTTSIETALGPVRARIADGSGPTVVFSHPVLADGRFWEPAVAALAGRGRAVVPDLPLGAHRVPVPDRDALTLRGLADALIAVAEAVGDEPAVLVGNDTGGAIAQLATARHPDRVAGLVLAPCEVFEHCPPRGLRLLAPLLRRPGGARLLVRVFGLGPLLSDPGPLNLLTRRGFPDELVRSWLGPALEDPEVLADLAQIVASMTPDETLEAAEELARWDGRAAVVWSRRGVLFPPRDGRRIAAHLAADPVTWVDDAGALAGWDAPEATAATIAALLDALAGTTA